MDLSKIFLSKHRGVDIIQFCSISVSFGSIYFFLFQNLGVRASENLSTNYPFQLGISCNKGLKANISCFLSVFLFNPPETGMF